MVQVEGWLPNRLVLWHMMHDLIEVNSTANEKFGTTGATLGSRNTWTHKLSTIREDATGILAAGWYGVSAQLHCGTYK